MKAARRLSMVRRWSLAITVLGCCGILGTGFTEGCGGSGSGSGFPTGPGDGGSSGGSNGGSNGGSDGGGNGGRKGWGMTGGGEGGASSGGNKGGGTVCPPGLQCNVSCGGGGT